ncbi:LuxR family transcriptional regulator [Lysobacter arseniciresistens ZS79]|uniref:LuxR family transcriptional regulator n=1 Tax=Lysobacter arseniciresistens ZS79 TaxID=913325 RepID=A0A0A0F430_9GAMM|nr:response regulator transcription factor [Lysobacter arseniciresistens]KGM57599.1 LuxR family transcriptional regulator [Lysobacter arseniciresistens ZS79]
MHPIRVLIADDHTLVRESLVGVLQADGEVVVVGQAADGPGLLALAAVARPDVVITDISMPGLNGIEVVRRLHEQLPEARVLVLTMHQEDEYVLQAVRSGASGYLVKDSPTTDLIAAVHALAEGRSYFGAQASRALAAQLQDPQRRVEDPYGRLTAREREVFHLIAEGLTTKEIARRLDISPKTGENHRARVLAKLEMRNTAELVRYALRRGLLD